MTQERLPSFSPDWEFITPPLLMGDSAIAVAYSLDEVAKVIIERINDLRTGALEYVAYESDIDPLTPFAPWEQVPKLGKKIGPCTIQP